MKSIIDFISNCTDCWHTVAEVTAILKDNGYTCVENISEIKQGGKYFITRNMSSVIAFAVPEGSPKGYMITAVHGDSPAFKIKAVPQLEDGDYIRLNTERYGGMLVSSWFDRPLGITGRVTAESGDAIVTRLVRLDDMSVVIPSLAQHLKQGGNEEISLARDVMPLYATAMQDADLMTEIADSANLPKDKILGCDLYLYNCEQGRLWGKNKEFITAPRLDDLQCVYACLDGFLQGGHPDTVRVLCVFDNEEVGSGTKQGAKSDFLQETLCHISKALGADEFCHRQMLNSSFLVSADNAHAIHPNRGEMSDKANAPVLNGGVVIKYNANQRYTTDAVSEAVFKKLCDRADVPYQIYANRSDIAGGSTLGNIALEKTSINAVDVGIAQLAMHSATETAGAYDTDALAKVIKEFYSTALCATENKIELSGGNK